MPACRTCDVDVSPSALPAHERECRRQDLLAAVIVTTLVVATGAVMLAGTIGVGWVAVAILRWGYSVLAL